ncbi:MAG: TIGR03088 family PEP-CTERM/XrtA system glycosyltransferase [Bryobacteraceae bacterium]|jgi:sugar transferase (PEP-CTERM/EpsH1 system associated)
MKQPPRNGQAGDSRPLVLHLIFRFSVGGLENGLVNLINLMPPDRFRHAVVSMTEVTDFAARIRTPGVPVIALRKAGGWDLGVYTRFWRVLGKLRPTIVHSRNLAALECQIVSAAAGVPLRIHGEHGRDTYDLHGVSRKYNLFRKAVRPIVHHYTAVDRDLAQWLVSTIGIPPSQVTPIFNGVDSDAFRPPAGDRPGIGPEGFAPPGTLVCGTVGRMQTVKDQVTLVRAFLTLLEQRPEAASRLRLVMIGEGALREPCQRLLEQAGRENLAWLPGERSDIPQLLRGMDLFVLPSIGEGMSNTILEAMATRLPVIATRVGGNPELVDENQTGFLVPVSDPQALASAIGGYLSSPELLAVHGAAGRQKIERQFSLHSMVEGYTNTYEALLNQHRPR